MLKYYGIPFAPSVFEIGTEPRPVNLTHSIYGRDGRGRAMHSHANEVELMLVCRGEGVHQIGERTYRSHPGDLLIYNVDTLHNDLAQTADGVELYCCAIADLCLKGLPAGQLAANEQQVQLASGEHFAALAGIMQFLECVLRENAAYAGELARNLAAALIVEVCSLAAGRAPDQTGGAGNGLSEPVRKMRGYINRFYADNFTLGELAEAADVSRYYAAHVFRKELGVSPLQYRLQRRIGEAQSLLTNTEHSVTYIAGAVGYDNPNHFTQRFTKIVGVSPREFRSRSVQSKLAARRR